MARLPLLPPNNLITPLHSDDLNSSAPNQQVTHPRRMDGDILCAVQEPGEIGHDSEQAGGVTYLRYVPSPPLDRYISYLYYLAGRMPFPHERILPAPSLDLKINLGGTFHIVDDYHTGRPTSLTESWLVGLYGMYHTLNWPPDMRLYGIRFKPNGVYPFLGGLPLSEFYNQVVALDAVWGHFASEIRERLYAAPSIEVGFALFERLLRTRLREDPHEQNIVEYGIAQIDRRCGTLSIKALSDYIGISQNHLLTRFKRVVGTSAKELARLYRFEHVLRSIDPTRPTDWSRIALQYGYYDQSHFNKDFKAFTGHSPTGYLHLRRQVYVGNALVDQLSLRNLPTE